MVMSIAVPLEIAGPSGDLGPLPVAVEGERGMSQQRGGMVARTPVLDGLAVCPCAAGIVHCLPDDRVGHCGLRHAPQARHYAPVRPHCRC